MKIYPLGTEFQSDGRTWHS